MMPDFVLCSCVLNIVPPPSAYFSFSIIGCGSRQASALLVSLHLLVISSVLARKLEAILPNFGSPEAIFSPIFAKI